MLVIIPLGIQAFIDSAEILQYWDYFSVAWLILGVFVATIAPEMLCGDRREKTLILYFSRPITRLDYLLSKLLATALLTLTITLVPLVIFWLGRQLLDNSPVSAMKDNLDDLWKIIVVSMLVSAYLGAIGLVISIVHRAESDRDRGHHCRVFVHQRLGRRAAGHLRHGRSKGLVRPDHTGTNDSAIHLGDVWSRGARWRRIREPTVDLDLWSSDGRRRVDLLRNHVLALCSRRLNANSKGTLLRHGW